jgi:hypothetical protein
VASTNWPELLYKFDTARIRTATRLVFNGMEGSRTVNGAIWDGEEQGLRGDRCSVVEGHGHAGPGGTAQNADRRAAARLVAERCGEAKTARLVEEAKVWQAREADGYLPPDASGREI